MKPRMPGAKWIHPFELYGDDIRELGRRFGDMRRRKGVTQRELAAAMCAVQNRVSDLELGKSDPRLSTLIRFADGLNCDLKVQLVPREEQ
jgi:transcriptional regulator with XRE-family HTH domain